MASAIFLTIDKPKPVECSPPKSLSAEDQNRLFGKFAR
jgi:hypothetical protein